MMMSERLAGSGGTVEWTDYLFAAEEMIGMRVEHSVSGVYALLPEGPPELDRGDHR